MSCASLTSGEVIAATRAHFGACSKLQVYSPRGCAMPLSLHGTIHFAPHPLGQSWLP